MKILIYFFDENTNLPCEATDPYADWSAAAWLINSKCNLYKFIKNSKVNNKTGFNPLIGKF